MAGGAVGGGGGRRSSLRRRHGVRQGRGEGEAAAAAAAMATGGKVLNATGEFFRRRDEWRKHPLVGNQLRHATPGLGIAIVAFGIYLAGEAAYNRLYRPTGDNHH
ncbi:hypothetical protein ZWY2020_016237 [Hordeum vulgare]|nr:hypothetical protein ZWY2020_016237 [Hordeum vulgare]